MWMKRNFSVCPAQSPYTVPHIALSSGDVDNAMKYARRVLELAREDDDFPRGAASSLLGLAFWTSGDLETAHQMFSRGYGSLAESWVHL